MIIGVTGSLSTGKTTVARMLAKKGAKLLDADKLAHMSLKPKSTTYKKVVAHFGEEILNRDRSISKTKLARLVFSDKKKLNKLTGIIHPFVIRRIKDSAKRLKKKDIVVIDAPLLIEAGLTDIVDKLIVVKTNRKTQLSRCVKKGKLKKKEVMARIRNQMPLGKKISYADYVIDNSGSLMRTQKQVNEIWKKLKRR